MPKAAKKLTAEAQIKKRSKTLHAIPDILEKRAYTEDELAQMLRVSRNYLRLILSAMRSRGEVEIIEDTILNKDGDATVVRMWKSVSHGALLSTFWKVPQYGPGMIYVLDLDEPDSRGIHEDHISSGG